jgi:hypothetical protein
VGVVLAQNTLPFGSFNVGEDIRGGIYEAKLRNRRFLRSYIWDSEFNVFYLMESVLMRYKLTEAEVKRRIKKEPALEMDMRKGAFASQTEESGEGCVSELWSFG